MARNWNPAHRVSFWCDDFGPVTFEEKVWYSVTGSKKGVKVLERIVEDSPMAVEPDYENKDITVLVTSNANKEVHHVGKLRDIDDVNAHTKYVFS